MRALLSVYDKTGLVDLARGLVSLGWELVSSGGTSRALADAGIAAVEVESVTASPEMLSGRVKTLHPAIHAGILADRDRPEHLADLDAQGIVPIDLVVCNLYPFGARPSVEMIDVGGPTMVRAAAKNHAHVGVVVAPAEYAAVLHELGRDGRLSGTTRRRLARAAFAHTAAYDAGIVAWLDEVEPGDDVLPPTLHLALERAQELRYGENPHQRAARYKLAGMTGWWDEIVQHSGLALSYLNVFDADAAWALVHDLGDRPAAAIIKHANPCGAAVADDAGTAYHRAFECDPMSAFGGIVALNRPVGDELAAEMVANPKADVVIAPGYTTSALDLLAQRRKNTRVLEAPPPAADALHLRPVSGGFLVQQPYRFATARDEWRVATKVAPTEAQWRDIEVAWRVCGHVRSNAIVLVGGGERRLLPLPRRARHRGRRRRGRRRPAGGQRPRRRGRGRRRRGRRRHGPHRRAPVPSLMMLRPPPER
ncbi:MAG TPA: bifunctional phosphoribosylaminoimidazolecarboxamide formyltransferase/IMP cyclohydrolase [Acidimicrobiales bacterium]|nr:bifunctional phosphoribosylaminoimidazolecarboxamide formyltransferase/IMP cyclohydrolase [Acidimicrobiales bacterium]